MTLLSIASGTFLPVAGGTFQMGSTLNCSQHAIREVTLSAFQMQATPVTNRQWNAYIEAMKHQRYGALLYGTHGQVQKIFRGYSKNDMQFAAMIVKMSASYYFSPVMELVPTAEAFRDRFNFLDKMFECRSENLLENGSAVFLGEDHPVVMVNWFEAMGFAEWIGGDLPTEAQTQYAARAG